MHTHFEQVRSNDEGRFNFMKYVCSICNLPETEEMMHLNRIGLVEVPDRSLEYEKDWWSNYMCPNCFEPFISIFPITPQKIFNREIHGKKIYRLK